MPVTEPCYVEKESSNLKDASDIPKWWNSCGALEDLLKVGQWSRVNYGIWSGPARRSVDEARTDLQYEAR